MPIIGCRFCHDSHGDLFLCKPARAVLDALVQRGMDMTLEPIEFPELVPQDGADFLLIRQLVVEAALAPVGDTRWPALVFTGQDYAGEPLPRWLYPGDVTMMRDTCRLVQKMAEMAIKRARG